MISEASNLILCFIVTLIWGGKYRHLHHLPLFIYQTDERVSWFLSTSAGIIRITWKLSPVQTLSRTCQDGSLGKSSPAVGLAGHGETPSPNSWPGRWGQVGVVPFYFACWPKPLPSSHQSRHSAGTRTLLPVNSEHTMAWNGLRPHAMCLDLFDVDLVVMVVCWNQFALSSFPLLPASTSHSPSGINSDPFSSSPTATDGHGCPRGIAVLSPLAIRYGCDWVLFQGKVSSCDVGGEDQWDLGSIWEGNVTVSLVLWMPVWTRTPAHMKYLPWTDSVGEKLRLHLRYDIFESLCYHTAATSNWYIPLCLVFGGTSSVHRQPLSKLTRPTI